MIKTFHRYVVQLDTHLFIGDPIGKSKLREWDGAYAVLHSSFSHSHTFCMTAMIKI